MGMGNVITADMLEVLDRPGPCEDFKPIWDVYKPIGQLYRPIAKDTCINCTYRKGEH